MRPNDSRDTAPNAPRPQGDVIQRNVWWSMLFARLLASNSELRQDFPQDASIVLLPDNDPELIEYNRRVARELNRDARIVYVEIRLEDSMVHLQPMQSMQQRHLSIAS